MSQDTSIAIQDHFAELTAPRRKVLTYPLINIVVMALFAVIGGADDFVAIAEFARTKDKWSPARRSSRGMPTTAWQ